MQRLSARKTPLPVILLLPLSGILLGLSAPGNQLNYLGFIALLPLILVLDYLHSKSHITRTKKLSMYFISCWLVAMFASPIGVPWMQYSMHAFANVPELWAIVFTSLVYGLEVGYLLFVCLALPMLFIKRIGFWDIPLRLSWFVFIETFLPQFFRWSFAGMALYDEVHLSQVADVIGSPRLSIFTLGFSFLLLLIWRYLNSGSVSLQQIKPCLAGYCLIVLVAFIYAFLRVDAIERNITQANELQVIAVQPNFSALPVIEETGYKSWERNQGLDILINASIKKLVDASPELTKLVVWPESVLPVHFMSNPKNLDKVKAFANQNQVYVLLATLEFDKVDFAYKSTAVSLLIDPQGQLVGRYEKITRIPLGEYLPAEEHYLEIANYLRQRIPNMGNVAAGNEYTVLNLSPDLPISATICFDVFAKDVFRNMSKNGAQLIFNLANLNWFGDTIATDHMQMAARWHSIENRTPVFLVSNNGRTLLIDATGELVFEPSLLNKKDTVMVNVLLSPQRAVYRDYKYWIDALFGLITLSIGIFAQRYGRIFCHLEDSQGRHSQTEMHK